LPELFSLDSRTEVDSCADFLVTFLGDFLVTRVGEKVNILEDKLIGAIQSE
jgi:hypothetical protein